MYEQQYNPQAEKAARDWILMQDDKREHAYLHDQQALGRSLAGSVGQTKTEETIVEREFNRLSQVLAELNMTMDEHIKKLSPVLMSHTLKQASSNEAPAPDEDLGQVGNNLRGARRRVEGVLAQFAELRYRLTV